MAGRSGRPERSHAPIDRAYGLMHRSRTDAAASQRVHLARDAPSALLDPPNWKGSKGRKVDVGQLLQPGRRATLVGRLMRGQGSAAFRMYMAAAALRAIGGDLERPLMDSWVLGQSVDRYDTSEGSAQAGKARGRLFSLGLIVPREPGNRDRKQMILRPLDDPWFERSSPQLEKMAGTVTRAPVKVPAAIWSKGWLAMLTKQETLILLSLFDASARDRPQATLGVAPSNAASLRPADRRMRGISDDAYEHRRLLEDMGMLSLVPLPVAVWSLRVPDLYSLDHTETFILNNDPVSLLKEWSKAATGSEGFLEDALVESSVADDRAAARRKERDRFENERIHAEIAESLAEMRGAGVKRSL